VKSIDARFPNLLVRPIYLLDVNLCKGCFVAED